MSDKLITPKARIAFANGLFQARAPKSGGTAKYNCTLIFDAAAQATPEWKRMREAVQKIGADERKHWQGDKFAELVKAGKVRVPFLKGNDNVDDAGDVRDGFADTIFIRPNSKHQPQVVDQRLQPIIEERLLFSGCYVRASLGIYTYSVDGNKGVAFGLRNVQMIAEGPALGGSFSKASDDFTPVESAGGDLGFKDDDIPF